MSDATYQPKTYEKDGGDTFIVASGGVQDIESGGVLRFKGVDCNIAFGTTTASAATQEIDTGLTTVARVIVSLESAPVLGHTSSTATTTGQSAAGKFILANYKPTATNDATPAAATTFTRRVAWVAFGT